MSESTSSPFFFPGLHAQTLRMWLRRRGRGFFLGVEAEALLVVLGSSQGCIKTPPARAGFLQRLAWEPWEQGAGRCSDSEWSGDPGGFPPRALLTAPFGSGDRTNRTKTHFGKRLPREWIRSSAGWRWGFEFGRCARRHTFECNRAAASVQSAPEGHLVQTTAWRVVGRLAKTKSSHRLGRETVA